MLGDQPQVLIIEAPERSGVRAFCHRCMLRLIRLHLRCIISSSGTEIVEPIGARLGVDKAIGTQMQVEDGTYTGEILFYAYGPGKAGAMRALAAEQGYDLSQSYAYSDSYTDLPMLEVVGHPFAVNPDADLRRVLETTCLAIGTVAVAYLAYWANRFTYDSYRFNDIAQGLLAIPMWIPQSSFAFGSVVLLIAFVDELVIVLRGGKPSFVVAVEQRHAAGDFSSDV